MSFLHNAGTVAKYEAVILRRSWFFRLFAVGALFIFTFMNIGLFSPVGDQPWELMSIPSTIPLINLYLLNIGQAIVVIFLAADFLRRDKKLDTNEVLYTRSMSNFEYVMGKTWGIIRLFLGLDIIILCIGLLMNIISKNMSIDLLSYFEYLLIFTIPTIVFSLGLAFLLMSVIRNQAITFLVLLGIAALDMFWLWYRAGSVFDYMAFGLPVYKSGVIGFDNAGAIIFQRLLFFFSGIAMVMSTVLIFKRLPQSKVHTSMAVALLFISIAGAAFCGFRTYSTLIGNSETRKRVTETNSLFENRNFPVVTEASIDMIHKGESLEAGAYLKIINNNSEPLDSYLFSLNPSLIVNKITTQGKELEFKINNHIIEIRPLSLLLPGSYDSLKIEYSGKINEAYCVPDISNNLKDNINRIAMLNVSKRQFFLTGNYLLLTPETHWYPVASLNYYPSNPARIKIDFTKYTLRVRSVKGLVAVSQGKRIIDPDGFTFTPESPLTGLTIAIGDYRSDTLKVDSVTYIVNYFAGNDYYKKDLAELKDTLPNLVSGIMRDLETSFSSRYPFKTLSLVEVPVQFYSYSRQSTQTRSEVQPSIILVPEKLSTLENAGFGTRFKSQKKRMARNNQVITDKELKIRLFNDFMRENFISGTNTIFARDNRSEDIYTEPSRYRLGPSFYFYRNNFYSSEFPVINAVFESHLQHLLQQGPRTGYLSMFGSLSEIDKANLILRTKSFSELLAENPKGDTIRVVLGVKGDWLFNLMRSEAGIEDFNKWFRKYCEDNEFRSVDIMKFRNDLKDRFGFDFYPYLDKWFNGRQQPGFMFSGLKVSEIIVDERSRYQVTFFASNPEAVPGVFNISFRGEGPGGSGRQGRPGAGGFSPEGPGSGQAFMQGRGMEASDIEKIVLLEPLESKIITLITDRQPRAVIINTLFSRNIPGEINMPVGDIIRTRRNQNNISSAEKIVSSSETDDSGDIIVDNEDPGFSSGIETIEAPLKRLFGITNRRSKTYMQVGQWNIPEYWQPVVQTSYYGKYVRSAVYKRAGSGDRPIAWTAKINVPGYYDIYCYVGKGNDRRRIRTDRGGGPGGPVLPEGEQEESRFKDFHYKVYHDDGIEEITVDYENAEPEWNNIGRFYLSKDTAKVVLSDQSSGRLVIGDAVKWVRVE